MISVLLQAKGPKVSSWVAVRNSGEIRVKGLRDGESVVIAHDDPNVETFILEDGRIQIPKGTRRLRADVRAKGPVTVDLI